ncbi:hypothetical protein A2U01_0118103, partial [Trifolium medium]|nr:hypothetical protein [Trifolium medium]
VLRLVLVVRVRNGSFRCRGLPRVDDFRWFGAEGFDGETRRWRWSCGSGWIEGVEKAISGGS